MLLDISGLWNQTVPGLLSTLQVFHLMLPNIEDNIAMNGHHWCGCCHKHIIGRVSYVAPMFIGDEDEKCHPA